MKVFTLVAILWTSSCYGCNRPIQESLGQVIVALAAQNQPQNGGGVNTNVAPPDNQTCYCGVSRHRNRIVGGSVVNVNEYPWQAALVNPNGNTPYCGGSLIHRRFVLTASHCVHGKSPGDLQVLLGEHDVSTETESETIRVPVAAIIRREDYDINTVENDFAILELARPVHLGLNKHVTPVCLPTTPSAEGDAVVATGWGTTAENGEVSNELRQVDLAVLSDSSCAGAYGHEFHTTSTFCAGFLEGGKDACQGDSGGPLVRKDDQDVFELVGLTSWGKGCARKGQPGVYADVNYAMDWILTHIGGQVDCERP